MRNITLAIVLAFLAFITALVVPLKQPHLRSDSSPSLSLAEQFSTLYVFGDSLSDDGNVFRATQGNHPPDPPYFQGRYSNGQVWVEYLADRLQLTSAQTRNFAYGGATAAVDRASSVPSLLDQVQSFTQAASIQDRTASSQTQTADQSKALYILWAGANDYLKQDSAAIDPSQETVENITSAITELGEAGARNILVVNLPDLGQLPATRRSTTATQLSTLTQTHNQMLSRSLVTVRQTATHLHLFSLDVAGLYQSARENPSRFGFNNVVDACLSNAPSNVASSHPPCDRPEQFLFWDAIHPTTATHRLIAEAALRAIAPD